MIRLGVDLEYDIDSLKRSFPRRMLSRRLSYSDSVRKLG